jgi:two-component system phosphate regulon sensor histidine kinase PhoR
MEEYRRDFIGNVSHELKTPIFNLQGYLDTLLDGGYQDTNILVPYLQKAMQNVERLSTIVEDLNTIAELEANQLDLDMEKFNIKELVKEVFEDLEMKAQERNIRLSFKEINNFKPIYVLADYERIRQVVDNLVVNAINYGRNYGRVFVSFYDMDKNILVEVSDNGIGIEAEHLLHVFDRFYRVDKARSRNTGGSGLGLAIVKHVIEAHGQTISARSTPNIGSTFGFTLAKA